MPASAIPKCPVCPRADRGDIELAYMTGEPYDFPFGRAAIERHISHVSEPEALRLALGMSAATALAARLRHLESAATSILDLAMQSDETGKINGKLALQAIREARATMELMGRVAGTLIERHAVENCRPDLDAQIAEALASARNEPAPTEPATPPTPPAPLELSPAPPAK